MGISVVGAQAESGSNDFTLNIGTSGNTTFALDKTYPSGRYEINFVNDDTTYDIYAVTAAGSYVGYTNGASIDITQDFRTVVALGAANNEKVTFTFSGPIATAATKGDITGAAAFLTEVVTAALPNIDDTTVVNGGNFAEDVEISFIGQDTNETNAKNVVRSSSTQLVVTRPDSFTPDQSPYTIKAVNPGIPSPTGSSPHILSNAVNAGTNPVWVTGTDIFYDVGGATSITLLATDTEASDIDYALVSGTLPAGLTLDGETGVISGTFSGSASEGDVTAITVRATDAGGNFLDKAFNLTANAAPTWTTAAGALAPGPAPDEAYSFQLQASTGAAGGALTYTLVAGALLTGHTLSSTGLISGTSTDPTDTVANFTVRVTDEGGLFAERAFSATIEAIFSATGGTVTQEGGYKVHTFTSSGTFEVLSAPAGISVEYLIVAGGGGGNSHSLGNYQAGGGGGAGGVLTGTTGSFGVASYAITVGAGGIGGRNIAPPSGTSSSIQLSGLTAEGGGGAGASGTSANGGSGAGGGTWSWGAGFGTSGQGNNGGQGVEFAAGGGGGAGSAGVSASSFTPGNGGNGTTSAMLPQAFAGGGGGGRPSSGTGSSATAGGGNGGVTNSGSSATYYGGGGGGGAGNSGVGGDGYQGIVVIRYPG